MELKSILSGLEGLKVKGNLDINVNEIRNSSNQVENGDMFVAIDGFDTDGHKYISEAIKKIFRMRIRTGTEARQQPAY